MLSEALHNPVPVLSDNPAMALVKSDNSMSIFIVVAPTPLDLVLEKWNIGLDKSPDNKQGGKTPYPVTIVPDVAKVNAVNMEGV